MDDIKWTSEPWYVKDLGRIILMDDLNVRAAKCLGWSNDTTDMHFKIPSDLMQLERRPHQTIHISEAKFTTSYDWAMLGIKEVLKIDDFDRQIGLWRSLKKVINNGKDWKDASDIKLNELFRLLQATPKQITQAWVEVLEQEPA